MASFLVDDCELDEPSTKAARTESSSSNTAATFKRVGGNGAKKMELFQFKSKAAVIVLDAANAAPKSTTAERARALDISNPTKTPPKGVTLPESDALDERTPLDRRHPADEPQPVAPLTQSKAPNAATALPAGEKRKLFQSTLTAFFAKPKPAQ